MRCESPSTVCCVALLFACGWQRVVMRPGTSYLQAPTPGAKQQPPLPPASGVPQSARGTHGEPRLEAAQAPGKTTAWTESEYRSALEACLGGAALAGADTREAGTRKKRSCRAAYRKQLLNNLGVLLVQKAAGLEGASRGAPDAKEPMLKEAVELFNDALALKPAWAEARHNLAEASRALEHLLR